MAQVMPQFCPRCGATTAANKRFCTRCGLDLVSYQSEAGEGPASLHTSSPEQDFPQWPQSPQFSQSPQSLQPPQAFSPLSLQPTSPLQERFTPQVAPTPASTKRRKGKLGLVLVLLLILSLLGTASYAGYYFLSHQPVIQSAITTTSINSTVNYAGVDITILNAQLSQRFIDDPTTADTGMLRLSLQGQNNATVPVNLVYSNIAHLVLSGGKLVTPTYVKSNVNLAVGASQTSIIDFAVPAGTKLAQLTLRLGAADEAQMDIPLAGHADLGQYAPKTANINKTLAYYGLDWVLVSATSQLSNNGQQAPGGMHYMILTLKVSSTLVQTAIPGSAFDYMRLKAGNTTASPVVTTLPVSFDAGVTGKTGTVTFLVPQNATTLTLAFVAQNGFDQATANFQLG